jgi:hypothetical protein
LKRCIPAAESFRDAHFQKSLSSRKSHAITRWILGLKTAQYKAYQAIPKLSERASKGTSDRHGSEQQSKH